MKAYKLEDRKMTGRIVKEKYFLTLNKAKKYFKLWVKEYRKVLVTQGECSYLETPIKHNMNIQKKCINKGRFKSVHLEYWDDEGTEEPFYHLTDIAEIVLREIKIN